MISLFSFALLCWHQIRKISYKILCFLELRVEPRIPYADIRLARFCMKFSIFWCYVLMPGSLMLLLIAASCCVRFWFWFIFSYSLHIITIRHFVTVYEGLAFGFSASELVHRFLLDTPSPVRYHWPVLTCSESSPQEISSRMNATCSAFVSFCFPRE
jgi:hypothetical protein